MPTGRDEMRGMAPMGYAAWHGNTVLLSGQRTDVVALSPAQMVTADMIPDDPGTWLTHCHVSEPMDAGMAARYRVSP